MHATATLARLFAATALCIVITAPVQAQDNGLESADGTPIDNPSGSTIEGDKNGIYSFGSSFKLTNEGTIRGNGTNGGVSFSNGGVVVTGGPADITNSGSITGARFGITTLPFNGTQGRALFSQVTNTATGTIIGDNDDGVRLQGGGAVTNSGYIAGRVTSGADGVSIFSFADQDTSQLTGVGSVTNNAAGIIEGFRNGIIISGGGTVDNSGTVSGNSFGVVIQTQATDPGKTGSLTNSGTINGGAAFFSLTNAAVTNNAGGSISATNGFGVLSSGPNSGSLSITNNTGGTITGSTDGVHSDAAALTLDNAGTIRGNGTTGGIDFSNGGVVVTGGPASITNSGTISGARFGITTLPFNDTEARATFSTVNNSGTIIGDNEDGVRLMGGGTVINSGYIAGRLAGGADGVSMFAYPNQNVVSLAQIGSVTNSASGVIEGNRFGIILSNGGTVNNAGTITGNTVGIHLQAQLFDPGRVGTIVNSGTINGGVDDFGLASFNITNQVGGLITSATDGIYGAGSTLILDNAGTIRGNGTTGGVDFSDGGVVVTGGPANITNSGAISGARFGITTLPYGGTDGRAIGSTITNSGSIVGDNDDGIRLRGGGTVTNSGYIAGRSTPGADGISMFTYDDQLLGSGAQIGSVNNLADGTIEGNRFGIILSNGGTVNNAGTITGFIGAIGTNSGGVHIQAQPTDPGRTGTVANSGTINSGVSFFGLASSTLDNSGTISASGIAVLSNNATTLDNSGTISGTGPTVVQLSDFADTVTLQTGSSINGAVDGGGGSDSLSLSGTVNSATSSQTVGQFLNFENLNVIGGYWTAPAATGTFTSTNINGGTFALNGTITSPIAVNAGGALGGTGTITGNVTVGSGGLLSPGNSIGILGITGSVVFNSGSMFSVETNPNGTADRLAVSGAVTINKGATLQILAGIANYAPTTTYTILTATGGIDGKFDKATTDYNYFNVSVNTQKKGTISIQLMRNGKPLPSAATPATFSAASAIDSLGVSSPLYQAVLMQTLGGARQAFNALSGAATGRLDTLIADDLGRLELGLGQRPGTAPAVEWSGVRSIGARGVNSRSSVARGKLALLMVGGRYASHIAADGATGDVDTRFLTSAVGYKAGRFRALAGATTAWHDVNVSRAVDFPGFSDRNGSHRQARTNRLEAEVGYALSNGPLGVLPYAGYSRTTISSAAYSESGGISALSFGRSSQSLDRLRLGLRMGGEARFASAKLAPHLDIAVERNSGDLAFRRSASFGGSDRIFDSIGSPLARRDVAIDAGLDFTSGPLALSGKYQGRFANARTEHLATLSARFRF